MDSCRKKGKNVESILKGVKYDNVGSNVSVPIDCNREACDFPGDERRRNTRATGVDRWPAYSVKLQPPSK